MQIREYINTDKWENVVCFETETVPDDLLNNGGFLECFRTYCYNNAPYLSKSAVIAGAIALVGFLAGRRYTFEGTTASIYACGLAGSGTGKDFPRKVISKIIMNAMPDLANALTTKIGSAQGLEDLIFYNNGDALVMFDEVASLFEHNAKNTTLTALQDYVLELYSADMVSERTLSKKGENKSNEKIKVIAPSVSIFGTATPTRTGENLSRATLEKGLLNRFLFFADPAELRKANECIHSDLSEDLMQRAKYIYKQDSIHLENIELQVSEEAQAQLRFNQSEIDNFYNAIQNPTEQTVLARVFENLKKLAMVFAISRQSNIIDIADVERASKLTEFSTLAQLYLIKNFLVENEYQKLEQNVFNVIKSLNQRFREIPYRNILQNAHMSANQLKTILNGLQEKGYIKFLREDGLNPEVYVKGCNIILLAK